MEDQNPRLGARKSNSREEGRRGARESKGIEGRGRWMKRLGRKILETPAMHAKKLRECRGKGIKPGRGNEKTIRSLLHKAVTGRGRVIGVPERSVRPKYEGLFVPQNRPVRFARGGAGNSCANG
jgi:hypothetical protein